MQTNLKEDLIQIVLEYATKMNKLELKYSNLDEEHNDEIDFFPDFKKEYFKVFKKYCTTKKRVYGGKGDSYSEPPQYDGIEKALNTSVEIKNTNRAEVYFKTNNNENAESLFIVLQKNDEWRIDSYKYKRYNQEEWGNGIL